MPSFLSLLLCAGVCVVSAVLIPESDDPCDLKKLLVVEYPVDEAQNKPARPHNGCGMERDLQEVSGGDAPAVSIQKELRPFTVGENPFDENAFFFTLVMVDPDAPTDENNPKYFLHWLIADIQGPNFTNGRGHEIKGYTAPDPPAGSGLHRYQFFAFKQSQKFKDGVSGVSVLRNKFDLKHFQESNQFSAPIAGYQFQTKKE